MARIGSYMFAQCAALQYEHQFVDSASPKFGLLGQLGARELELSDSRLVSELDALEWPLSFRLECTPALLLSEYSLCSLVSLKLY